MTPKEAAALEAENAQLKQQLAATEADKATKAKAKRHDDNVAYAEQLIGDGKLAPKHKGAVVAFLDFSEADTSLEFGEGDAKQPLATAFKSFLGELPKIAPTVFNLGNHDNDITPDLADVVARLRGLGVTVVSNIIALAALVLSIRRRPRHKR